jgi:hypothetical protein
MHTDDFPARRACPSFHFVLDEMFDTELLYVRQILYHAHAIVGPVTCIKVFQCSAGETPALETILNSALCQLLTGFDTTFDTGL